MDERGEEISIVELLGETDGGKCGYCKDSKGQVHKKNLGCAAYSLNIFDFENFLLWGWSRSGSYLYKPVMAHTCCPQYTIRLDSEKLILSRTQKRVIKNVNLFLEKGIKVKGEKEERREKKNEGKREEKKVEVEVKKGRMEREGRGEKKKDMRRKRAIEKWIKKGLDVVEEKEKRKKKEERREMNLEMRIGDTEKMKCHKLSVRLVTLGGEEYRRTADEEYELFKKYQEKVHQDDDVSRRGYDRFLVKSPLTSSNPLLGSFHMQYVLDGSIIAVGVVDVLSESVSAKYMFYDPDYAFLSLGTYTALREIELVRKLKMARPRLRYYYMGYYISDCPKMRYKGSFKPSDLLCDNTLQWVPLSECSPLLSSNEHRFTIFRPDLPPCTRLDPRRAKLYHHRGLINIDGVDESRRAEAAAKINEFCQATAPDASKMIMVLKELQVNEVEDEEDPVEEEDEQV